MDNRKIYFLISTYPGLPSRMIRLMKHCRYSHSSLGFADDPTVFYSFIKKGFFEESLPRYLKPDREPFDCELHEMTVTQAQYEALQQQIAAFRANRSRYRYAKVGITLNMLGIPARFENRYFCSHFVVELLHRAGIYSPDRPSVMYFPEDLARLPGVHRVFHGKMDGLCRYLGLI